MSCRPVNLLALTRKLIETLSVLFNRRVHGRYLVIPTCEALKNPFDIIRNAFTVSGKELPGKLSLSGLGSRCILSIGCDTKENPCFIHLASVRYHIHKLGSVAKAHRKYSCRSRVQGSCMPDFSLSEYSAQLCYYIMRCEACFLINIYNSVIQ